MKNGSLCIWRWVAWPFIQLLLIPDYQQQSLELGYFEITAYSDTGLLIVLIASPSTIDKIFEIYTFFENRFEIYTCILFENRTEILSMVDGLTIIVILNT